MSKGLGGEERGGRRFFVYIGFGEVVQSLNRRCAMKNALHLFKTEPCLVTPVLLQVKAIVAERQIHNHIRSLYSLSQHR